jgi:hypothetical protein
MLDVLGTDYIFQHILQTLEAERKETLYRYYVTDVLQVIAENTSKNGGMRMNVRYCDLLKNKPQDNRSGKEIAADVIRKAGLIPAEPDEIE